ncbi:cyclohexa-1,5-dienecarbonyl-CoA hydratase [Azospirillum sp. TSO22-1]|uniref:cyclohexa-1,5-dienecarbonyl-CoA hydratase n=1 Tax=Azospirillum sp. TSO22-1 TaxID=716789 RepID=UPI000D620EF5|nr:cyclohexa-1,5-dienecarbonyl-CoA hydratase [Azospirillum sp. TSO22-1]PWC31647.1 cyclohexa-1,5-dienecarbonyl-CoA hydratase [Azospirillum sp. TSO22-1]
MTGSPLQVWRERDGRLLRLRLARPKANIVDAAMIAALDAALAEAQGEAPVRAVLLDHEGPHFSFGASVQEHLPESFKGMLAALHQLVLRMVAYPVPILVSIKGQCLGGGLEVAASGHLLFASPDAKFGQPEIVLGVFAPAASCLLPERMGRALAEDLLFSGRSIDAAEAARSGLLNAVADDPEAAALAWFDAHVVKHSASSLRFAVAASRQDMVERVRSKLAHAETIYIDGLMSTRDAVEGLTAFLDKRAAHWEDR